MVSTIIIHHVKRKHTHDMQKRMGRLKKSRKQISKKGKAKNKSRAKVVIKRHIRSKKLATKKSKRTLKAAYKARLSQRRKQELGPAKITGEKRTKSRKMKPNTCLRIDVKRKNTSSIKNKDPISEIQQRGINTVLTCCKNRKPVSRHQTSNNAHNDIEGQIIEENYIGTESTDTREKDIGTCLIHIESESTSLEIETDSKSKQDNYENKTPKFNQETENIYWNSSDNQSVAHNRTIPQCSSNIENSDYLENCTYPNIYNKHNIKSFFRERKLNGFEQSKKEGNEIFKSIDTGNSNRNGVENNPLILEEHKYSKDLPSVSTKSVAKSKDNTDGDDSTVKFFCRKDYTSLLKQLETCGKSGSDIPYLDSKYSHSCVSDLINSKNELSNSCKFCHMVDSYVTTVEDGTIHKTQVCSKPAKSNVDFTVKCINKDTQQDLTIGENKTFTLEIAKSEIVTGVTSLNLLNDSPVKESNIIPSTIYNVQNQEHPSPPLQSIKSKEHVVIVPESLQKTHNGTHSEGCVPISIKRVFCNDKFDIAVDKLLDANRSEVLRASKHVKTKKRRLNSENATDDCVNRSANVYLKGEFIRKSLTIEPAKMTNIEHSNKKSIVNELKEYKLHETPLMNGECSHALVQSPNVAKPKMRMTKQKIASSVASVSGAMAHLPHGIGSTKTTTEIKCNKSTPIPGPSTPHKIKSPSKGGKRKTDILGNKDLEKCAYMLWSSEKRRYYQQLYPSYTSLDIDNILGSTWQNLGVREKVRYFNRAQDAVGDNVRTVTSSASLTQSTAKKTSKVCGRSSSRSTSLLDALIPVSDSYFYTLTPLEQCSELEAHILYIQYVLGKNEYANFINSFKIELLDIKGKLKLVDHRVMRLVDEAYRRLLFENICKIKPKVLSKLDAILAQQQTITLQEYNMVIKKIIAKENVEFSEDACSQSLTATLKNLSECEVETISSKHPIQGSKSFECVLADIKETANAVLNGYNYSDILPPLSTEKLPVLDSHWLESFFENDTFTQLHAPKMDELPSHSTSETQITVNICHDDIAAKSHSMKLENFGGNLENLKERTIKDMVCASASMPNICQNENIVSPKSSRRST